MNDKISEGNELIAEFMGITPSEKGWYDGHELQKAGLPFSYGAMGNGTNDVKFHESWDWLMPVVEKIESIVFDENNSFNVTIGSTIYCVIQDANGECYDMVYDGEESKLLVVYKAIVEFIKWYNENCK